jgi:hypothetical protein
MPMKTTVVGWVIVGIGVACLAGVLVILRTPEAQRTRRQRGFGGALGLVGLVAITVGGAMLGATGD